MTEARPTLVICGNGASAVALLHALAIRSRGALDIFVIGDGELGHGLAYATRHPDHRLNAPASRMSIDPDAPGHFVQWLTSRDLWSDDWPDQFVSRIHYGRYLADVAQAAAARPHLAVRFVRGEIVSLTRNRDGWRVAHRTGQIDADFVVLATGNDMPSPLAPRLDPAVRGLVVDNPWTLPPMRADERVLILGTGLTAIDTLLSLSGRDRRHDITLLSRHGLLPQPHVPPQPMPPLPGPFPRTALAMLLAFRDAVRASPGNWQDLMDAMRPHWPKVWREMPLAEQRRFLRHAATMWNMHRHRLPPQSAQRVRYLLAGGARILTGRLTKVESAGPAAAVTIRGRAGEMRLQVDRIVNCMGPNTDPAKSHNRLIENIVASLQARTAPPGVGLDVTADSRVIAYDGAAHLGLFAMGALTRGTWWEITAVPEIARQAGRIAECLLSQEKGRSGRNGQVQGEDAHSMRHFL